LSGFVSISGGRDRPSLPDWPISSAARVFQPLFHPPAQSNAEGSISAAPADELELSLDREREWLEALKDNWDGYGARALRRDFVGLVFDELKVALDGSNCLPPDVIPGADGSLQAEWHLSRIEVLYRLAPDGFKFLSVARTGASNDIEVFGPDALVELRNWAPQLTPTRTQLLKVA
jgi:hypothetical protein